MKPGAKRVIKEKLDIFSDPLDKDGGIDDFFDKLDDSSGMRRRRRHKIYTKNEIQDRKQSVAFQIGDTRKSSMDGVNWNKIGNVMK